MTSMTTALLNTVSFTPVTLIVRVSDRRELTPQGPLSCGNALDQNGRSHLCRQRCRQDSPCPSASSFCKDRFVSGEQVQPARSEALAQSITAHAFGETVCYHAARVDPLTMSDWSEPISSRNSPSGVSQTIWRSAARSILSLLSLHLVNVGLLSE